jgi:hypothetical protein
VAESKEITTNTNININTNTIKNTATKKTVTMARDAPTDNYSPTVLLLKLSRKR